MQLEVVSKIGKIQCMDNQIYTFMSDFNNIKRMLPPEHASKMECTTDTCTITASPMPTFTLAIVEREPSKLIKIGTQQGGKDFFIWLQFKQIDYYDTRVRITLRAEMNMVMKTMLKGKLQKFVDQFVDALCQIPPQAFQYMQTAQN